jgi:hypothetical protein
LVTGLKERSGDSKGKTIQEYIDQTDTFAKVSHWTEQDTASIAKEKEKRKKKEVDSSIFKRQRGIIQGTLSLRDN